MGWATWARIGVGSSRTDVFTSGQTLARDRALEGYQPQFDGLRALAVLTVMVDHFSADVPNFPLPDWIHLGATGVRLFLVLAVTLLPPRCGARVIEWTQASYRRAKRWQHFTGVAFLRIGPAYLVFAAIALLLDLGAI